jgi:PEGA domain-containing protein
LELEPATYEVFVSAFGFRPLKSQINVNAGKEMKIDLVLEVAGLGFPSKDGIVGPCRAAG